MGEDGKPHYKMLGEGDLPIANMMLALRSINYDGYVSLEWVKRWARDLSDAGVVFPQSHPLYGPLYRPADRRRPPL